MPDPSAEIKFKNKYRIPSTRSKNWNYASAGYYYVTICTYNRVNHFGSIVNNQMVLSGIGRIAEEYWRNIPGHFPFVELDEFIIMPNHIHGVIVINNKTINVETQNFASLQKTSNKIINQFAPQSKNLPSIIRGYKAGVKKWATMNNIDFKWQPRFYDHVIRDRRSLGEDCSQEV
jgi:putative transposase